MPDKINKNTIPEGFTVPMALVDFIPVIFFGGVCILLGRMTENIFIIISAALIVLSGLLKVIWKIIAAVKKKNIWALFIQMRIVMPLGFLMVTGGLIFSLIKNGTKGIFKMIFAMPQLLFFILGILGITGMIICSIKLDSKDPKSNWIEQTINSFAQGFIFTGVLLLYLNM